MSQLYQCDRCKSLASECIKLQSRDLCAQCLADFDVWVATGALRFKPSRPDLERSPRNAPETSMLVARVIAAADPKGKISARTFSEATQETYRASYYRLRYLYRRGFLERVSGNVYRLPAAIENEAAE